MKALVAAVLVVAAVVSAAYLYLTRSDEAATVRLAPVGDEPFSKDGTIAGAYRGMYDTDGTRLAVFSRDGLALSRGGKSSPLTRPGSKVVDAAWFTGSASILVAEGPIPTGTVAVVRADGSVHGTVALQPSVGFGSGYGMSVAPDNQSAAVTAVERPALGAEQRHLVLVELTTGKTRPLTELGGANESGPFFVDSDTIVYNERSTDGGATSSGTTASASKVIALSIRSGSKRVLNESGTVVGVVRRAGVNTPVVQTGRVLRAGTRRLGSVPPGATVAAVHPSGRSIALVETVRGGDAPSVTQLRRFELEQT